MDDVEEGGEVLVAGVAVLLDDMRFFRFSSRSCPSANFCLSAVRMGKV